MLFRSIAEQDGDCQQCGGKGCVACDAREQEPVAWVDSDWHYQLHKKGMVIAHKDKSDVLVGEPQPLYTYPQQWVGITDEEFEQMLTDAKFTRSDLLMIGACVEDICNMVEAKLRERNT